MSTTFDPVFQTLCLWLKQRKKEQADQTLNYWEQRTNLTKHVLENIYVHAWRFILEEDWQQALPWLLMPQVMGADRYRSVPTNWTLRRWSSTITWLLGNLACQLGRYTEASEHYHQCLSLLEDRRMGNDELEIQARYRLGICEKRAGFLLVARTQQEEALRQSQINTLSVLLPWIYYELADLALQKGDFSQAVAYGKLAKGELALLHTVVELEVQICILLGRTYAGMGASQDAASYYVDALAAAKRQKNVELTIAALLALADIECARNRLAMAWAYCDEALSFINRVAGTVLVGSIFLVCGKVSEARHLQDTAFSWYQRARVVFESFRDASQQLAVYEHLAKLLMRMNRDEQARTYVRRTAAILQKSLL